MNPGDNSAGGGGRSPLARLSDSVNRISEVLLFVLMMLMIAVTSLQIVCRVFFEALIWSEELTTYLLVASSLLGAAVLVGGILTLALFVWWESRCADPLLDLWLFRHNRVFALSNLASFINYSATFAVGFLVSLYLQYIKGYSAESAGLVLVAQPALQALVSPWAGRL